MNEETIKSFWNNFLKASGREKSAECIECFHFEMTEQGANELLRLVLEGKKTATSSSYPAYAENENVPKPGDLSIVTDWGGNPWCVIETVAVTVLPFKEISYDLCKREGEDDCLESWRESHRSFFEREGKVLGYTFTEEMPVIFEDFMVIYTQKDSSGV